MILFDDQCQALLEVLDAGGLFAQLSVGKGKTLIAALIPTMLQLERTLILTHKQLVDQVHKMLQYYRSRFYIRPDIRVVSYETLSSHREEKRNILENYRPSIVIADEAQAVARVSARTRRFQRFFKKYPESIFAAMSGSHGKRQIKESSGNMALALGVGTPLPMSYVETAEWGEALDVSDNPRPGGVLREFAEQFGVEGEPDRQLYIRNGWRERFLATKGVIASSSDDLDVSLTLHQYMAPMDEKLQEAIAGVENFWERPDGEVLMYATDKAKTIRQIRVGGFYRWNWKAIGRSSPDEEWLGARKAYHHEVREFLQSNRAVDGLDSPGLIAEAHINGDLCFSSWDCWDAVRGRPEPPPEWIWLSRSRVDWVASLGGAAAPCVVWTDVAPFRIALAKAMGVRAFGGGPLARAAILELDGTETIVASIKAHGVGRNLQMYNRAIVAGGSSGGETWEQLLGRLHRTGQKRDVRYDVLFPGELESARNDAHFKYQTTGAPQKLLTCSYV